MAPPRRPAPVRGFRAGSGRTGPISPGRGLERRGASGAPGGTGRSPPFLGAPPRRGAPASPPAGKPTCFYTARRVSAGISTDRLRTMEQKILGEIRSQLEMARARPAATTPLPWLPALTLTLALITLTLTLTLTPALPRRGRLATPRATR